MYDEESFGQAIDEIAVYRYDGVEMSLGEVDAYGSDVVGDRLDEYDLDLYMLRGG
ncbi:hypothetical protein [Halalkalicoccus ordinarius]|uniref:hypothetical protein n=1 Tax=Halalkalicoccus ordinarius TaxID=3116651 RepID=UPI00300F4DE1